MVYMIKSKTEAENFYQFHIFCCTNKRENTQESNCCASKGSESMLTYFKNKCKELNLGIRVSSSGCLGRCKYGKVMVIYPQSVWYRYDTEKDIDEIIEQQIVKGKFFNKLKLSNQQR